MTSPDPQPVSVSADTSYDASLTEGVSVSKTPLYGTPLPDTSNADTSASGAARGRPLWSTRRMPQG
jgi:hypothetical protein